MGGVIGEAKYEFGTTIRLFTFQTSFTVLSYHSELVCTYYQRSVFHAYIQPRDGIGVPNNAQYPFIVKGYHNHTLFGFFQQTHAYTYVTHTIP